jgi:hypothetical protein
MLPDLVGDLIRALAGTASVGTVSSDVVRRGSGREV